MPFITMRSGLIISFTLGLFLLFAQPGIIDAQESQAGGTAEISQNSIEKLLQDLEDPQKLDSLKEDLRALLHVSETAEQEADFESRGILG
ncbi:MAG: hypothetical protein ABR533_12965, partial [Desulfonatronovibrio sp.]